LIRKRRRARLRRLILFLHNRYRTTGGEERAVEDLLWLVRDRLGEDAELLTRDSALVGRVHAAAGMLGGGLRPEEVARAVRRTGARIVHAHNLHPTLGWRALSAARQAGARVLLHLHQYRLVCAVGVCFTHGEDCTRCHGRNTLPGVIHNCRGSILEAVTYAAGIGLWQPKLVAHADAFVVPSRFALERLRTLRAPIGETYVLPSVIREFAGDSAAASGRHALVVARLAPEKGVDVAIEACRIAGIPLIVAGDGPERARLAPGQGDVEFAGHADRRELAQLRRTAALALVPSRSGETFGLAAAESMAAGLPVAGSRVGALPELLPEEWLVPAGDPRALAAAIVRLRGSEQAGALGIERSRAISAPDVVASRLREIYGSLAG
jgi:glycosyltransferase involved in cell wall biosynthesis